jgi:hypothetical protein
MHCYFVLHFPDATWNCWPDVPLMLREKGGKREKTYMSHHPLKGRYFQTCTTTLNKNNRPSNALLPLQHVHIKGCFHLQSLRYCSSLPLTLPPYSTNPQDTQMHRKVRDPTCHLVHFVLHPLTTNQCMTIDAFTGKFATILTDYLRVTTACVSLLPACHYCLRISTACLSVLPRLPCSRTRY